MDIMLDKTVSKPAAFARNAGLDRQVRLRGVRSSLFRLLIIILTVLATLPLLLILFYIFKQGITAVNWHFLVNLPKPVGEVGGGVANAIVGTVLLIAVAAVMAIPFGILIGIYLSEATGGKLAYFCHLAVDVLQGIPSIVIGIVIYEWVVRPMGEFSSFSGSVALGLMMLPSVIKSTEETLKLLPASLKEASLALGVPYYKTIIKVILPSGMSGILGGVILSISRVIGETAPLLFTAFGNPYMNTNIFKPMSSLPLLIFNYATSPYNDWHQLAWGASMVLIVMIVVLNLISKLIESRWKAPY
jgi:phosphate transport system permease protein